MFAPPSKLKFKRSNKSVDVDEVCSKEKIGHLIMKEYLKNTKSSRPSIQVAEEIQKFIRKKDNNTESLHTIYNNINKIAEVIGKNQNPEKVAFSQENQDSDLKELKQSKEVPKISLISSTNIDEINKNISIEINNNNLKPQSKFENESSNLPILNLPQRTETPASKMSGVSKFSAFTNSLPENFMINQLIKNYNLRAPQTDSNSNLPYDIDDFDSMIRYDTMLFNQEKNWKKFQKREIQRIQRLFLQNQIDEKKLKESIQIKTDIENELAVIKELDDWKNKGIERQKEEKIRKAKEKDFLDKQVLEEAKKKVKEYYKEKTQDKEIVRGYIEGINEDNKYRLLKKIKEKEFFDKLKEDEDLKKSQAKESVIQERVDDIKWNKESDMIFDKMDKERKRLYKLSEPFKLKKNKNEDEILINLKNENIKKCNDLQEKINGLEGKLNTLNNGKNSSLEIKKTNLETENHPPKKIKIIRPLISKENSSKNQRIISRKISNYLNPDVKMMSNTLVVNSLKNFVNLSQNITPVFTTQLKNNGY